MLHCVLFFSCLRLLFLLLDLFNLVDLPLGTIGLGSARRVQHSVVKRLQCGLVAVFCGRGRERAGPGHLGRLDDLKELAVEPVELGHVLLFVNN